MEVCWDRNRWIWMMRMMRFEPFWLFAVAPLHRRNSHPCAFVSCLAGHPHHISSRDPLKKLRKQTLSIIANSPYQQQPCGANRPNQGLLPRLLPLLTHCNQMILFPPIQIHTPISVVKYTKWRGKLHCLQNRYQILLERSLTLLLQTLIHPRRNQAPRNSNHLQ